MQKKWYNPSTWSYPRAYGALLALVAFGIIAVILLENQNRNREAIRKGCILLNNAIIRSSTASSQPATRILVTEILRQASPQTVADYKAALAKQGPTIIPLVDCDQVANHPDAIKAIQLKVNGKTLTQK